MKIAYVIDEPLLTSTASANQVVQTAAALGHAGVDVTLMVPVRRGEHLDPVQIERHYGIDYSFQLKGIPSRIGEWRPGIKTLQAMLAAGPAGGHEFDLVYTRVIQPMLVGLAARRPTVLETYRPLTRQFPLSRRPFRWVAERPAFLGLITHSEFARRAFLEDGLPIEKVRCIHNGYDAKRFSRRMSPIEARAKMGLPERPTVVYAGRIAPLKRIDLILDAARALPNLQFVIAGGTESPESQIFVQAGQALPNVVFPGYLRGDELPTILQAADALVIPPSRAPLAKFGSTVLPIKTFQYLAAGRPIVTGDVEDTAELLRHEDTAIRCRPDDPEAFVAALTDLFARPKLQQKLAKNARILAGDLTWDARAQRVISWLDERLTHVGRRRG